MKNKMNLRFSMAVACLAPIFAACSVQNDTATGQTQPSITFVSGLHSPSARLNEAGDEWVEKDQVGIYMLKSGTASVVDFANVPYQAESSGAVTIFQPQGSKISYPIDDSSVDFISYYPYTAGVIDGIYPISLANQTTSLTAHDLMFAKADNEGRGFTSGSVSFTYAHQLSKFTLQVVDNQGASLAAQSVTVKGMNTVASFDLMSGTLATPSTIADIQTYGMSKGYEAVLLPFTLASGHAVEVVVDGKVYTWNMNGSYPALEVKPGYAYTFNLKINSFLGEIAGELIDFNGNSVAPWGDGDTDEEEDFTDLDLSFPTHENDDLVRAFPGAEGGGMFTTGGRGGRVIKVTNLNDSGTGSLRAAVDATGARTIVFEVDGIIELKSRLVIRNSDITIAGQTAPGDGICLKNYSFVVAANNVIIRYIRSRMGDETQTEDDAMWGRFLKNVIIDHCSMSWSTDECSSFYASENLTVQWTIISESLRKSVHGKGNHGYGAIVGGVNASFHHNLLAHHDSRNPRFDGGDVYGTSDNPLTNDQRVVDFRNCVVYNYSNYPAYGGEGQKVNFVGNYYKWGPASIYGPDADTNGKKRRYFYRISGTKSANGVVVDYGCPWIYMGENSNYLDVSDGNDGGSNANNWAGLEYDMTNKGETDYTALNASLPILPDGKAAKVTTHAAAVAFERVMDFAGANLKRDAVDERAVNDTRTRTAACMDGGNGSINGIIDTQSAVGGWPTYKAGVVKVDSDGDGMPDAFEKAFNLNMNDASDGNTKTLDPTGRYTNLEVYLHYLVRKSVNGQVAGGNYTTLN